MAGRDGEGRGAGLAIALCVGAGLLLRGLEAALKSFWLDELHTLDLASCATLAELNAQLGEDTHTPAFYAAVQLLYGAVAPHLLRWIAIVPSLLALVPLHAVARSAGLSAAARVVVVGLYAVLPFQVQWGAELRPYAWLELAVITAVWASFTPAQSPSGKWVRGAVFAAATVFGLYTHLFTTIAVLGIGAARLVFRRREWLGLPALIASGVLAVGAFAPWLATTHPWLFDDPSVLIRDEKDEGARDERMPAAEEAEQAPELAGFSRQKLAQVPVQTLVPRMGSLGGLPGWMARVSFGGLLVLGAFSLLCAVRGRRAPPRELLGPLTAALVTSLLLAWVCVQYVNRIPLQYFVLSAWAWPLVFGALIDGVPAKRRALAAALLLAAGFLGGLGHALGAPREDLSGAVRHAVAEAEAKDAWLTAVLWQPNSFAHSTPYWVYAEDSDYVEPDEVPPVDGEGGRRPIVIVTRNAPDRGATNFEKWAPLRRGRERLTVTHFDGAISVYVYGVR